MSLNRSSGHLSDRERAIPPLGLTLQILGAHSLFVTTSGMSSELFVPTTMKFTTERMQRGVLVRQRKLCVQVRCLGDVTRAEIAQDPPP